MNLVFNEADHTYEINGILVPGCTTITGLLPKEWMGPWVAKETCAFIEKGLKEIYEREEMLSLDYALDIVKKGKGAWRRKADKAAESGTTAHAYLESYIKDKMGLELLTPDLPADPLARNAIELFFRWELENQVKWLHSEVVVGSERFMFGGKFDAIAAVNGLVTLIDFKTSSGIHKEYYYQLAGYQSAYEEMKKEPAIAQRMVLWIPKTGADFEARIVPTPYEQDRRVFLNALALYKSLKESERTLEVV